MTLIEATLFEQIIALILGFVLKPVYMSMSAYIIYSTRKWQEKEIAFLRWGLMIFLVGEFSCMIDFLFFNGLKSIWEYIHSISMLAGWMLIILSFIQFIDVRLLKYSDPATTCRLLHYCVNCHKKGDHRCGIQDYFKFVIALMILLCTIPFSRTLAEYHITQVILGDTIHYLSPIENQILELRIYPALAALAFGISLIFLIRKKQNNLFWSQVLFSAGCGLLVMSLFRLFFTFTFQNQPIWSDFWEQATEFAIITFILLFVRWLKQHNANKAQAKLHQDPSLS